MCCTGYLFISICCVNVERYLQNVRMRGFVGIKFERLHRVSEVQKYVSSMCLGGMSAPTNVHTDSLSNLLSTCNISLIANSRNTALASHRKAVAPSCQLQNAPLVVGNSYLSSSIISGELKGVISTPSKTLLGNSAKANDSFDGIEIPEVLSQRSINELDVFSHVMNAESIELHKQGLWCPLTASAGYSCSVIDQPVVSIVSNFASIENLPESPDVYPETPASPNGGESVNTDILTGPIVSGLVASPPLPVVMDNRKFGSSVLENTKVNFTGIDGGPLDDELSEMDNAFVSEPRGIENVAKAAVVVENSSTHLGKLLKNLNDEGLKTRVIENQLGEAEMKVVMNAYNINRNPVNSVSKLDSPDRSTNPHHVGPRSPSPLMTPVVARHMVAMLNKTSSRNSFGVNSNASGWKDEESGVQNEFLRPVESSICKSTSYNILAPWTICNSAPSYKNIDEYSDIIGNHIEDNLCKIWMKTSDAGAVHEVNGSKFVGGSSVNNESCRGDVVKSSDLSLLVKKRDTSEAKHAVAEPPGQGNAANPVQKYNFPVRDTIKVRIHMLHESDKILVPRMTKSSSACGPVVGLRRGVSGDVSSIRRIKGDKPSQGNADIAYNCITKRHCPNYDDIEVAASVSPNNSKKSSSVLKHSIERIRSQRNMIEDSPHPTVVNTAVCIPSVHEDKYIATLESTEGSTLDGSGGVKRDIAHSINDLSNSLLPGDVGPSVAFTDSLIDADDTGIERGWLDAVNSYDYPKKAHAFVRPVSAGFYGDGQPFVDRWASLNASKTRPFTASGFGSINKASSASARPKSDNERGHVYSKFVQYHRIPDKSRKPLNSTAEFVKKIDKQLVSLKSVRPVSARKIPRKFKELLNRTHVQEENVPEPIQVAVDAGVSSHAMAQMPSNVQIVTVPDNESIARKASSVDARLQDEVLVCRSENQRSQMENSKVCNAKEPGVNLSKKSNLEKARASSVSFVMDDNLAFADEEGMSEIIGSPSVEDNVAEVTVVNSPGVVITSRYSAKQLNLNDVPAKQLNLNDVPRVVPGSVSAFDQNNSQSMLDCGSSTHSMSPQPRKQTKFIAKRAKNSKMVANQKKLSACSTVPKCKQFGATPPSSKVSAVVSAISYAQSTPPWIPEYSYPRSNDYNNDYSDPVLCLNEKILMEKSFARGLINDNTVNMANIRKQRVVKASFEKYTSTKKKV